VGLASDDEAAWGGQDAPACQCSMLERKVSIERASVWEKSDIGLSQERAGWLVKVEGEERKAG
jgi:hypothetical protein